jgi:dTDP-4-dehydrorhamnose reductase
VTSILVTGGTGQVGIELARWSWPADWRLALPSRAELDLASAASIRAWLADRKVDAIVNSGAYTAVDKAESEPDVAFAINAEAPAILAEIAAKRGIPIVQLSTDYVFDGEKDGPYVESDPVAPLNVYGVSKAGGEKAVRAAGERHLILRTAWVVSPHGRNFASTILRLAGEKASLDVVADQKGAPTAAADIAGAIATILPQLMAGDAAAERFGTFHFCSAGVASWYEVATAIAARAAAAGRNRCEIRPIRTADYPTAARRPANSRLDTGKLRATFGNAPGNWRLAVDDVLDRLLA